MLTRYVASVLAIVAVVLTAAPARAQIQTGSLLIKAIDEQGAVMPGATITVTSPALPREAVGVTDASGVYQVPGLPVGSYTIKTSLEGFKTVIREDVARPAGAGDHGRHHRHRRRRSTRRSRSRASRRSSTPGRSARRSTSTAPSSRPRPGGRDIWNIVEYKAPGVVVDSPDVGGNQGGLQRSLSARGTPNAQNTQVLNGVNVNDPAAQGFAMYYYVPTTLDNIQVSSGAQDIAVGTGGVFINMVTKSGTNRFSRLGAADLSGQEHAGHQRRRHAAQRRPAAGCELDRAADQQQLPGWRTGAPEPAVLLRLRQPADGAHQGAGLSRGRAVVPQVAARRHRAIRTRPRSSPARARSRISSARPTASRASSRSSATTSRTAARSSRPRQDSDSKELDTFLIAQLAYNRVLGSRMFLDSKISYNNTHFPLYQKTDLQPINDNTASVLYQNRASSQLMFRRRVQFITNWQYYLPQFVGGRHEFKAGFDNGYTPEDVDTTRVDDVNLAFTSAGTPAAATVQIFNSPLHQERAVNSTALYAQDAYTLKRLTLTGGIRWERVHGYLPAQEGPASQYFPDGPGVPGRGDQRRHPGLHRAQVVRGGAREPAVAQLGTRVSPRPTTSLAKARPSPRSPTAATSIRSTPARRPTRTPTSTRPTSGTT